MHWTSERSILHTWSKSNCIQFVFQDDFACRPRCPSVVADASRQYRQNIPRTIDNDRSIAARLPCQRLRLVLGHSPRIPSVILSTASHNDEYCRPFRSRFLTLTAYRLWCVDTESELTIRRVVTLFLPHDLDPNPTASSCWEDFPNDTFTQYRHLRVPCRPSHARHRMRTFWESDCRNNRWGSFDGENVSPTSVTYISYQTWWITTSTCQREWRSFPSWLHTWWRWKTLFPSHIHPTDNKVVQNSGRVTSLSSSSQYVPYH